VNANLNEIASIGLRTTSSSSRAVDACDRLSVLAGDLNELVGAFKVSTDVNQTKTFRPVGSRRAPASARLHRTQGDATQRMAAIAARNNVSN
jgi:hypothetical protein